MPLHGVARDGGLERAADAAFAFGLPDDPPPASELLTVAQVLATFRQAGCHGEPWVLPATYLR